MRKWKIIVCVIGLAGLLAACGSSEDEIQLVEHEDIGGAAQTEEAGVEDGTEVAENVNASGNAENAETSEGGEEAGNAGASGSGGGIAGSPAVVYIETVEQEYKESELLLLKTTYDKVTVAIEGNETAADLITEWFAKNESVFQESAAETLEWAKENTEMIADTSSYYESHGYTVARNDGRVLSFSSNTDAYDGGAHGSYAEYGVNFDAATGQFLTIPDITEDEAAFQEICVQEMLRQCEDLKAEGVLFDETMLSTVGGLQGIFEGKMESEEWYFTEDGIRFVSNIYEIAPYAAGNFRFDIPYEMVNETLKAEYRG